MKKLTSRIVAMGINSYLLTATVYAAVPAGVPGGTAITLDDIQGIITDVMSFLLVAAGSVMVIMIIYAGIKYMMAGDDSAKATEARGMLKNAIIGAAIVLGIGVILATVDYVVNNASLY